MRLVAFYGRIARQRPSRSRLSTVAGPHVFGGKWILEVCSHHLHSVPESPSTRLGAPVSADLEEVLLACLAKRSLGLARARSGSLRLARAQESARAAASAERTAASMPAP